MNTPPPATSSIQLDRDDGLERISIRPPQANRQSWIVAIAFAAFLVPWLMAYPHIIQVLSGDFPVLPLKAFVIFWSILWTLGGCLVAWCVYRIVRPSRPATLEFAIDEVRYDSGTAPLLLNDPELRQLPPGTKHRDVLKRHRLHFSLADLRTLRLEEANGVVHLMIDGVDRPVAIATGAHSDDRRWLYSYLKDRYGL